MIIFLFVIIFLFFIFFIIIIKIFFHEKEKILSKCSLVSENLEKINSGDLTISFNSNLMQNLNNKKGIFFRKINKKIDIISEKLNEVTAEPLKRVCYVGPDSYLEGKKISFILGEYLMGKGEIAVVITSNLNSSIVQNLRYKGFLNVIMDKFPEIKIIEVFEANNNKKGVNEFVINLLKQHPRIKGIYVTGSSMLCPVAESIFNIKKEHDIFIVGHDIDREIFNYINKNKITATMLQDPFAQGCNALIYLYNNISCNWEPIQPRLLTHMDIVTKDNCKDFWDDISGLKRSDDMINREINPIYNSDKKIKILIIGQDWNSFFKQIKTGVDFVVRKLKSNNASIEWITCNQNRKDSDILKDIDKIINNAINEKYNGIMVNIASKILIPFLKKAEKKGIKIVTFNSEFINFRSMINSFFHALKELDNIGKMFSNAIYEINNAMQQSSIAIKQIVGNTVIQNDSSTKGIQSINLFLEMIDNIVKSEEIQIQTIEKISVISSNISNLIQQFNKQTESLKSIKSDVNLTAYKIREMDSYSKSVEIILKALEDFSQQTNIISLNASIEAVKSGIKGKGFKVVADEIKKLVAKSIKSTNEINNIIKNMQKAIYDSINSIDKSELNVNNQVNDIIEASENLEKVSSELISIMNKERNVLKDNKILIQDMNEKSFEMSKIINKTNDIFQENSSSIEELSATIMETERNMKETANQVGKLEMIISVLDGMIAQFKIK